MSYELLTRAVEANKKFNKVIEFYGVSYVSDECVNSCTYCGHSSTMPQERSTLTEEELKLEFAELLKFGPPEICILAGEHPSITPDYLATAANIALKQDKGALERISFNVAPMTTEDFRRLRDQVDFPIQLRIFQESYDRETYRQHHPRGPKRDFDFRRNAQQRALDAGFDQVGIGALIGLNPNPKQEILGLIEHAYTLKKQPYSISIPRLQKVEGSCFEIPHEVDDPTYVAYHAILRIALPDTKIIITTRETPEMRDTLRPLINIEDLATKPGVGGNYKDTHFQNKLGDTRTTPEIVEDIRVKGYKTKINF